MVGGATILTFVALLYLVELIDQLTHHSLDCNGIRPLEADGLWGIIFAPVLHANWTHLTANTGPAAGAGVSDDAGRIVPVRLGDRDRLDRRRLRHLADRQHGQRPRPETDHIGASGLIFGWLDIPAGVRLFHPQVWDIVIGLGGPVCFTAASCSARCRCSPCGGVSWQGHLCGGIAGVVAAYLLSAPERKARALKKAGTVRRV